MTVKRYAHSTASIFTSAGAPLPDGHYVRASDHDAAIAAKDVVLDALNNELNAYVKHIGAKDEEIAKLHFKIADVGQMYRDAHKRITALEAERDEARALREQYRGAMYIAENDAALVRAVWKNREAALEAENAELRSDLAATAKGHDAAHAACVKYEAENAALREREAKARTRTNELEADLKAEWKNLDALVEKNKLLGSALGGLVHAVDAADWDCTANQSMGRLDDERSIARAALVSTSETAAAKHAPTRCDRGRNSCNHADANMCCGGGYDADCDCKICHPSKPAAPRQGQ